jgi:hypothetical protein
MLLLSSFLALTGCFLGGGDDVSAFDLERCRNACNQQQFFDCYDAAEHAQCFDHCDEADLGQIDRFAACVGNDLCDAECAIHIVPDAVTPAPGTPGPAPSGCQDLCLDYLNDGCAPGFTAADCLVACDEASALVVGCLDDRVDCTLPPACQDAFGGPADGPVTDCQDNCERMGFFDCITPLDAVTCSDLCAEAPASLVDQFNTCNDAAGICQDDSCYTLLNPSGGSADVSGCQAACDQMAFFDCLTPGQQSSCRAECTSASAGSVEDFKACAQGLCDDDTCFVLLQAAN